MELPPGWRGYGAKDHIDHPDTPKRVEEIERIKREMAGADRIALQATIMPYENLVPKRYQGPNEQIDGRLS